MKNRAMELVPCEGSRPFPPRVSKFTRPFWEALAKGRLITTRCQHCKELSFPPRPFCRRCWSEDVAWDELAPHGVLYSFTTVHVVPRAFNKEVPYSMGILDLVDGIRLLVRMHGDVDATCIGKKAEMMVRMYDDGPLFAARVP